MLRPTRHIAYEGVVRFGWSTTSYDRAGEPTSEKVEVHLTTGELEAALEPFRGEFAQRPPAVSAKKVDGRRSYELARKNIAVELAPVGIHVYELTLLEVSGSDARLRVHCSGGTYMRSIAHDLGQALGSGAHLIELRRLASGEFEIDQARTLEQLEALAAEGRLRPSSNCAGWPVASSKSIRRGPWNNWKRWPPKAAWWTRSCRWRNCCPHFRACSSTN